MSFWDILSPEERPVWEEIAEIKSQLANLRKGIFARHDKLEKSIQSLKQEIRILKRERERLEREKPSASQADLFETSKSKH